LTAALVVLSISAAVLIVVTALSLLSIALMLRDARRYRHFPALPSAQSAAAQPAGAQRVSVIIPARNEAGNIGRSAGAVLAQATRRPLELIVVDDDSSDATPQVLQQLAAAHAGAAVFKPVAGRSLPAGWLGKPNACAHGASLAAGDWLMFLDADTAPSPNFVEAMLMHAQSQSLDALSVWPHQELGTLAEKLIIPAFAHMVTQVIPLHWMSNPLSPPERTMGNGQCMLVRAHTYRAMGGHDAVRNSVLEDVHLARALRSAGARYAVVDARAHLRVRMYHTAREVVDGFAKNARAGMAFNPLRTLLGGVQVMLTSVLPPFVVFGCLLATVMQRDVMLALATVSATFWWGTHLRFWRAHLEQHYGVSGDLAALMPLGVLGYFAIAARGVLQGLLGRGIEWKGRRVG
jgi:chlorobactene glucosyltransferase